MLNRNAYFIREHVGMLKLTDTYDILDPETKDQLGVAKENPGTWVLLARLFLSKRLLPTRVEVFEGDDPKDADKMLFAIRRGVGLFSSKVQICDPAGNVLGWLQSKVFSLGGTFRVFSAAGEELALLKGDWKGWNFRFLTKSEVELGTVTKKWAGIGKELFTSADNYMISLHQTPTPELAVLLLAAGLAIDTVYKEH